MNERERRLVTIGAVVAGVILVIGAVLPLQQSVADAGERVQRKRNDLAWLRSVAPQLTQLGTGTAAPQLNESMVVVIDRSARGAGLAKALVGSQPEGNNSLNVRLESAAFDSIVAWISQLRQNYGIEAESATVDATNGPGDVNATLVLRAR